MDRTAIALGLGLLVFGQLLFLAGPLGILTRATVFGLLILMAMLGVRWRSHRSQSGGSAAALLGILAAGSFLVFLQALYPPTGWDATMYHLTYARIFADEGSLVYLGHLRFPVFPQLNEMWFTAALLVANDVTAQLTQWLCFVITALAIAGILRTLGSPHGALIGVAIWFSVPLLSFLASNAYVECGLAMAATLAFAAWLQWRETDDPKWAFLTGAFAGMAAATKYHGLFFVAWFGVAMLIASRRRFRHVLLFALAVLLVAGPWYARIAAWTGNPIFPYGASIFGANDWQLNSGASLHPAQFFEASTFRMWLALNMYNVRPWIYVLIPLAAAGAFFERRVRFLFFAALTYVFLFWRYDSRFLVIIIPLLAIASATLLGVRRHSRRSESGSSATALLEAALAILILLPVTSWNAKNLLASGPLPRTPAQRDAYIDARIWPYAALRFLEQKAGPGHSVYVFRGENASYFWRGRYLGDYFGPYRYTLLFPLFGQPDRLAQTLRSFGVEYVIVRPEFRFPHASPFERLYASPKAEVFRIRSSQ